MSRVCVDCVSGSKRPAPHPGPRCATHNRAVKKARSTAAWATRIGKTYSLSPEAYAAIYEAQGGVCALCRRATGKARRLAIDHDHSCCPGPTSCGRCVRSLLCSTCNSLLGHFRDDPETVERVLLYLEDPPGRRILNDMHDTGV